MSSVDSKTAFKISNPSEGPELTPAQLNFMKLMEAENLERVTKLQRTCRRNTWTGWGLTGIVFGIYAYSIYAVKQERFLDDFDEPEKVIDTQQ